MDTLNQNINLKLAIWLFALCLMIVAMIFIGGVTRLTGSGLSMVEWRPFLGFLPPLTETEWTRVFELYKLSPEFKQINSWMEISDFKFIFFWEYFHRLWGRIIGIIFLFPLIIFWWKNMIPKFFKIPLIFLLFLGVLQSIVGWWMVKSGLANTPDVSHYRLATHLILALIIFSILVWLYLNSNYGMAAFPNIFQISILFLIFVTIAAGALVSGMKAGLLYNEYPLMGNTLVPIEYGEYGILDAFENPASVQFHHRTMAFFTLISVVTFSIYLYKKNFIKMAFLLSSIIIFQFLIGIFTLINYVPIWSAALHQFGALILLTYMLNILYFLNKKT